MHEEEESRLLASYSEVPQLRVTGLQATYIYIYIKYISPIDLFGYPRAIFLMFIYILVDILYIMYSDP